MRICLIGDYQGKPEEGMKNIAFALARELEALDVSVQRLDVNQVFSPAFIQKIRRFDPHVIHYIPGLTWRNLLLMKILGAITQSATAISLVYPRTRFLTPSLLRLLRPSVVFIQSNSRQIPGLEDQMRTTYLPNGVDTNRFAPLSSGEQRDVRSEFGLDPDAFIVLHVGHITKKRNLNLLIDVQRDYGQVVLVVSNHFSTDSDIRGQLEGAGCHLIKRYLPNVEEIYGAADCYVFPTRDGDTIVTPLSVLEAMSCNLPVVTLEHPGLRRQFDNGSGFYMVESEKKMLAKIRELSQEMPDVRTRSMVKEYSWRNIARRAVQTYHEIRTQKKRTECH